MSEKENRKAVLNEVIKGYRKVIQKRYTYSNLSKTADIPESFDENRVKLFRDFFLENLYPSPEKREELNEAFESLDVYIQNPKKLTRLMMDSTSLIFKFGRHLPKLLKAGLNALKSFRKGNKFEEKLVDSAIAQELAAPYSEANINSLIKSLSPKEIEEFIVANENLFETLYDRKLVGKIKEIIQFLINKMKKRSDVYSEVEINGLEMGYEIINKGDALFESLSDKNQRLIIEFVISKERDILENLFDT